MYKRHEKKLAMYKSTNKQLVENADKTVKVPVVKTYQLRLADCIEKIDAKKMEYLTISNGPVETRDDVHETMLELLIPVCFALSAHAVETNDIDLQQKTRYSESEIRVLRLEDIAQISTLMATLASSHESELAEYGFDKEDVAELQKRVSAFNDMLGLREKNLSDRISSRTELETLFRNTDQLLRKQLDKAIESLKSSETQFYNAYFSARQLRDLPNPHKATPEPGPPAPAMVHVN